MPPGPETNRLIVEQRTALDGIVDEETRRLVRAWARAWDGVSAEWEAAALDLTADGGSYTPAQLRRSTRARRAIGATARQLDRILAAAGVMAEGDLEDMVAVATEYQPRMIASQLPSTAGPTATLAATFDRVDEETLAAIVQRSTEQITSLFDPLSDEATEAMLDALVEAVPRGLNPRQAARTMVRRVEGRFNGGLTRALTISRTELLDAHRAGAQAHQEANSDVLAGWVWTSALDTRTCPSCWAKHGSQYPVTDPGPLDHQQGRCARTPVTRTWRELGFDVDEPPSALSDAREVFEALPEEDQLAVMGPGRLGALRSGTPWDALSMRRTSDGWRDSFAPTPVRALA